MSTMVDIKKELLTLSTEAKKLEAKTKDPLVGAIEKAKCFHDLSEVRNKICVLQFELENDNE